MFVKDEEKYLERRKFYVKFIVILMVVILIAFNFGSWIFLSEIENSLEKELSTRLGSIATLSANNIELTPGISLHDLQMLPINNYTELLLLQSKLITIQMENQLEGVYLIDQRNRIIIDASGNFNYGDLLSYIQRDSLLLASAWDGRTEISPIFIVEGSRFKTGYAPVTNILGETVALLVLEANADFFQIIKNFKRGLVIIGLASLGAIILFSFFLSWTIDLFINTQEELRKREKLALLGQMSASVAHEIRNPLGVIKATADVLRSQYERKNAPNELFDYIGTEVNRLNNMVNDFLSFAREIKLNLKQNDFIHTIKDAVRAFDRDIDQDKIELTLSTLFNELQIKYDEEKIKQVLLNLLVNSRQAIHDKGEIKIDIKEADSRGHKYIAVAISDDGSGIEGDPNKIFEPFYTTKSTGSGLGLAITRQIIEGHGGWLNVESKPDHGTTITFYIPEERD